MNTIYDVEELDFDSFCEDLAERCYSASLSKITVLVEDVVDNYLLENYPDHKDLNTTSLVNEIKIHKYKDVIINSVANVLRTSISLRNLCEKLAQEGCANVDDEVTWNKERIK